MTEEEAKNKSCCGPLPITRAILIAAGAELVGPDTLGGCVASACMAWRWIDTHVQNPADPQGDLIRSTRTHGACGLAGPWFQNYQRPLLEELR